MNLSIFINVKVSTIVGILTFISLMNTMSERERSSSVAETQGLRVFLASPASLHCVLERHINPSLVLVQSRKTRYEVTERLWTGT